MGNKINKSILYVFALLILMSIAIAAAPNVTLVYPTNTTYAINISTMNYTYDECNATWYNLNGAAANVTATCSGNSTNLTGLTSVEGNNTWIVYVNSSDGAINTTSITFTKDTIFPEVTITLPENTTYSTNISALNYSLSETGSSCWYNLNGAAINVTATCGTNLTLLNSTEGSNTWTFYTNDSAGNENSSSVTFWKDTVLPTVTISYPTNTTYTVTDTVITSITYALSETGSSCWYNTGSGNTSTVCGTSISSLTSSPGSNTWYVYMNDSGGNEGQANITFTTDRSAYDSCQGTQVTIFAAFGLLALISIVGAGFLLMKMDGDAMAYIVLTIAVIGLGIVLMVGYRIVSSVATTVC